MEQLAEKYNCNVWWSSDIPDELWENLEFVTELLEVSNCYRDQIYLISEKLFTEEFVKKLLSLCDYEDVLRFIPKDLLTFELLEEYVENSIHDICYVAGGSIDGKRFKEIYTGTVYVNECSSCDNGHGELVEDNSHSPYYKTYEIKIKGDSVLYIEGHVVRAKNVTKELIN